MGYKQVTSITKDTDWNNLYHVDSNGEYGPIAIEDCAYWLKDGNLYEKTQTDEDKIAEFMEKGWCYQKGENGDFNLLKFNGKSKSGDCLVGDEYYYQHIFIRDWKPVTKEQAMKILKGEEIE